MRNLLARLAPAAALGGLLIFIQPVLAQGTAFTYQGQLSAGGSPANGLYDFRFKLESDPLGDFPVTGFVFTNAVPVSNGLFAATIDFGTGLFTGSNYWLDVEVRTNNPANTLAYTALLPLQALTPVPYAIFATTAGNLSGLLTAGSLSGTYGSAVTFNNAADTFNGSYTGNGANVTNVNAAALAGLGAGNFWQLGGNTVTAGQFLGSTNSNPVEIWAGGSRALRLEPVTGFPPNIIGGYSNNFVSAGVVSATIAGGGYPGYTNSVTAFAGAIGGGYNNQSSNTAATISGGANNVAGGNASIVGGGSENAASGDHDSVSGGQGNAANGGHAAIAGGYLNAIYVNNGFIGGGQNNIIQTNADHAAIGGGWYNTIGQNNYEGVIAGGYYNGISNFSGYSFIGGGQFNTIQSNSPDSTIGGGAGNIVLSNAEAATIGGGYQNTNGGPAATVAGGYLNLANAFGATVGGGQGNLASGQYSAASGFYNSATNNGSVVAGGGNNFAGGFNASIAGGAANNAAGQGSAIGGGYNNTVSGNYGMIPGGNNNTATNNAFAAGTLAQATNNGAFVWADSEGTAFSSTNTNSFNVRANGGIVFVTSGAGMTLDGQPVFVGNNGGGLTNLNVSAAQLTGGANDNVFVGPSGNATTTGQANSANGAFALLGDSSGSENTANGYSALYHNTSGSHNTAIGNSALYYNMSGAGNTATGDSALADLGIDGPGGSNNTAYGFAALAFNTAGISNIALGYYAGSKFSGSESYNIDIGNSGVAGENNIIRLGTPGIQTSTFIAGVINGNGGNVTNVNAITLNGLRATNFWQTGGNSGTTPAANYLGTSDYQPLELHVNGIRAFRLEPTASVPNVIGGYSGNLVDNGAQGVTIGGGGTSGFNNHVSATLGIIAGGSGNVLGTNANDSTIGGGRQNLIDTNSWGAFIGGGHGNWIQPSYNSGGFLGNPSYSVIGGGYGNVVGTNVNNATIGGGGINTNSGNYATIPGGLANLASASYSFAAGYVAQATNQGAFVWSDSSGTATKSFTNNQFMARASGGVVLLTSTAASPTSYATGSAGVALLPNATAWTTVSDRNAKKNFQPVDTRAVLDKLAAIPIQQWNYKWEKDSDVPNIGPMAQDFKAAFFPGRDDKGINTLEFDGVELAAIQGLNQKLEAETKAKDAEIEALKQSVAELKQMVQSLAEKK